MKDHRKTLLSSPSSKDSHSNIAKISICQILIIFLLRGAGEMGEADQSTGSARYHVLFAMSFCLLVAGLLMNAASQWIGSGMKLKKK